MDNLNAFMVGRIAIRVIVVDGPVGSSAKFTVQEIARVLADTLEAQAMLQRLAATNRPRVPLQFASWSGVVTITTPPSFPALSSQVSKKDTEDREKLWRDEALLKLVAFGGTAGLMKLRNATIGGADHAFTVFWTKYECGLPAYTRPLGPHIVMCWPWLVARRGPLSPSTDTVLAHEIGHIFGAADEYKGCTKLTADGLGYGKLNHPNHNCEEFNVSPDPCLMRMVPNRYCNDTRKHVGWIDSNKDGILDVLQ